MEIETFFDEETMSVHLREGAYPLAKKGYPSNWKIVQIREEKLTREKLQIIAQEIMDNINHQEKSFLEKEREGSSIIQLGVYRIVITRKPFSDGLEITAVKPVAKLNLEDYQLDQKLKQKLTEQAAGVIIAGSPGEGKTTLARALAEQFAKEGKIVKTVESPRDMLLSDEITQYSLSYSERGEIHDVLLLSRPDRTFFDEMRTTEDFLLFADLRLAGIGMMGVVHATNPVDAIQRCIGRIELGIIPQVVDTVVFVKNGEIAEVLELKMLVKVPSGMVEADLARPVVEIRNFTDGRLMFEIYSYGDHTAVIPVEKKVRKKVWHLAEEQLKDYFKKYSPNCKITFVSDQRIKLHLPEKDIARVIGSGGKNIEKIEKELGLKIDVQELIPIKEGQLVFEVDIDNKNIVFYLEHELKIQQIGIYDQEDLLLQARASKKALIKLQRKSALGKAVEQALKTKRIILHKVL